MLAVVTGAIATYPVGGVAWDYGQYALGLERLGFDVVYLEDNGLYTYDADRNAYGRDPSYGVRFLEDALASMSATLGRRWHYRHLDGETYGIARDELLAAVHDADLFLNVSGLCALREEYMPSRRKLLIDTDPGWNHFHWFPRWDRDGAPEGCRTYRDHDVHFTYALEIGRPGCRLPAMGIAWNATRPPVVLDCWRPQPSPSSAWTTIMTWDSYGAKVDGDGVSYGSKVDEFDRIEDLPSRVREPLELALGGERPPTPRLQALGWRVVPSLSVSRTPSEYRAYVERSRGELSVAKNVYVATRSGWTSCRSACYLAAGRPCVVQDTGFTRSIPCGDGLIAFGDADEAAAGIARAEADRAHHEAAARQVAAEWFDSDVVLGEMLDRAGV